MMFPRAQGEGVRGDALGPRPETRYPSIPPDGRHTGPAWVVNRPRAGLHPPPSAPALGPFHEGGAVPDPRKVAVQMQDLLELARSHGLDLAAEWIEERYPSATRRNGTFSQQRVDRIRREELGAPDGD